MSVTALREKGNEVAAASLERRDLPRDHDSESPCVAPGGLCSRHFCLNPSSPSSISSLFPRLQVFIGLGMVLLFIQRDHPLPLVLLVFDGLNPIVT